MELCSCLAFTELLARGSQAAHGLEFGRSCGHLQLPCKAMARICTIAQQCRGVFPLAGFNAVFKSLFQSCLMQHQSSSPDKAHSVWELGWKEGKFAAERSCRLVFIFASMGVKGMQEICWQKYFYRCEPG